MLGMSIILDGDEAWPDLRNKKFHHVGNGAKPIQVATLTGGLQSGRPSVAIRIDLDDGQIIVAETTARLFCSAAKAIMVKYPDLFVDGNSPQQH